MGGQPPQAHGVDVDAVDHCPASAVGVGLGGVRHGTQARLGTSGGDALGGGDRGARGRVDLVRVVELDDLGGLEVGGGLRGEAHGQHGGQGEVRGDEDAAAGGLGLGQVLTDAPVGLLGPAGGAHDDVHSGVEQGVDIGLGDAGDGEVDGDVGARQVLGVEGVPHVQAGHEFETLGVFHRLADGRSHAPGGAHNSYANRHGPTLATHPPTARSRPPPDTDSGCPAPGRSGSASGGRLHASPTGEQPGVDPNRVTNHDGC